ncbi:MAG TPA: transketolase [Ruminiclostridium sp.]|jgi:transketolase|nr:transketolase [Ruminiclostridium sp.]
MLDHTKYLTEIANNLRKVVLKSANNAGTGHVGGSLSEIDILTALYFSVLNIDPSNPDWENRDRFILSKGHASLGLYSVLAERGYFSKELLDTFDQTGTKLQGHPDMNKCPGIDFSTGSLGQGLSIGIGISIGAELRKKNFKTFVLIGDGESQEGQVWEALMYAGVRKVKNLVAIFDYNKVQLSSMIQDNIDLEPFAEKISAFNWNVIEMNGHDMGPLESSLKKAYHLSGGGPVAVIAHTIKGKGVSFMENKFEWHGKAPDSRQLAEALAELEGGQAK